MQAFVTWLWRVARLAGALSAVLIAAIWGTAAIEGTLAGTTPTQNLVVSSVVVMTALLVVTVLAVPPLRRPVWLRVLGAIAGVLVVFACVAAIAA